MFVNNALFTTPVVEEQSLGVIFLSVAEKFNKQELLLSQASLWIPALESSSEEILSHHSGKVVLWAHIVDLLLMDDRSGDTIDEHDGVSAQIISALGRHCEHIRVQVFVKQDTINAELSWQDCCRVYCKRLGCVLSAQIDDFLVSAELERPHFFTYELALIDCEARDGLVLDLSVEKWLVNRQEAGLDTCLLEHLLVSLSTFRHCNHSLRRWASLNLHKTVLLRVNFVSKS